MVLESESSSRTCIEDRSDPFATNGFVRAVRRIFEAPSLKVELSSRWPRLGDTLAIQVEVPPPRGPKGWMCREYAKRFLGGELRVKIDGEECRCYPKSSSSAPSSAGSTKEVWRVFVPFTPLDKPGKREITVELRDGRSSVHKEVVGVVDVEFPTESIWLPKRKSKLYMTDLEREKTEAFREVRTAEQLWEGPFIRPCDGPMTTAYGMQRYYNGVFAKGYYHRGVDYGAPEGTPVIAPANGIVSLSGREKEGFVIHGNCVGLDHGHGVASIFMHLSELAVREGEYVRKGQLLGRVGDTGISTGPHLHWGLYVNGECISPNLWMENSTRGPT